MSNKYLLKEFTSFEIDDKESQLEPDKEMILKGILQRCNTLNQNGRIYPRDVLTRELNNYMKLIRESRAFGELDHADSAIVNMKNVSHMVMEIWMEGDAVWGKVKILDTPMGNIIRGIIKGGGRPGISSRALGSLAKEGNTNIVQDDLQIICWDFVSEPSTPGAFMMMTEAKLVDSSVSKSIFNKSDRVDRILNDILALRNKQ